MATVFIQKRKSKDKKKVSYQVQYKDPLTYKTCYYKTFSRSKDAKEAAQDLRYKIDNGKLYQAIGQKRKINLLKFSQVSEIVVSEWKERTEKNDLGERTFEGYTISVNVLNRTFGENLLLNISKAAL
jgi:hypothetical protein